VLALQGMWCGASGSSVWMLAGCGRAAVANAAERATDRVGGR
jgi:hypothetical protein